MKSSILQPETQPFHRPDWRGAGTLEAFPPIENDYQPVSDAPAVASTSRATESLLHAAEMRSFRLLSQQANNPARRWDYLFETAVFLVVVGLIAWPLVSLVILLAQTARG